MSRAEQIQAGIDDVTAQVAAAASRSGRDGSEVTIVAVTKTWPLSDVELVAAAGLIDVGENRHQDARAKAAALPGLRWHFLGQLQTNKAKAVGTYATVVHSVDRAELLAPLARGAMEADQVLDVLLQLSVDRDTSRGGTAVEDLARLADAVAETDGLRIAGLMTVAPLAWEPRRAFFVARKALDALVEGHPQATTLSAGMSGDFAIAVEEGSTMVRVGSAIFGARTPAVG